jgi:hypothetical protein
MALADRANQYIDREKPWLMAREPGRERDVQAVCTQGLNAFRSLVTWLKPVLPRLAAATESFLRCPPLAWDDAATPLLDHEIGAVRAADAACRPAQRAGAAGGVARQPGLVNNVVLVKFLGLCPFMGVSKKLDSALGMGWRPPSC